MLHSISITQNAFSVFLFHFPKIALHSENQLSCVRALKGKDKNHSYVACAALLAEIALGVTGLLFSLLIKLTFSLSATYSESAYPNTPPISVLRNPLIRMISAAE